MNELQAMQLISAFQIFLDELQQSIEKGFSLPLGQLTDLSNIRRKCFTIIHLTRPKEADHE